MIKKTKGGPLAALLAFDRNSLPQGRPSLDRAHFLNVRAEVLEQALDAAA
jgi:hypothetical protein